MTYTFRRPPLDTSTLTKYDFWGYFFERIFPRSVYKLTRFSETIGSKLFHRTEVRTELLPLLIIAKGVDHPGTHAAKEGAYRKPSGKENIRHS